MPPAPTSPRIVAARMLMSSTYSEVPTSAGITCGVTPVADSCTRVAPVDTIASRGPWRTSSIESASNFVAKPIVPIDSASTPGNGPSPTAATNSTAMISSGSARMSTRRVRPK
jgi:hypothetical protein